jgi:hypothetical protein
MKLYEYCVIHNPLATKDEKERGEKPTVEADRGRYPRPVQRRQGGCDARSACHPAGLHGQAGPRGDRAPPFLAPPAKQEAERGQNQAQPKNVALEALLEKARKGRDWRSPAKPVNRRAARPTQKTG